ncbi:MAG: PqiC family protein [Lysobacterales bacterium]|jgi:uncharacterized lipoprotein YmbA
MTRTTGIALLMVLLAACGSSPRSNYYLLTSDVTEAPAGNSPSLGIGPIAVPEYLNRNSLVYSKQGNRLQISSTERWAEPLEAGIKRILSANLASQLDTQDIRSFPWDPAQSPDYGVAVSLWQLDANEQRALLAAEWRIVHPATGDSVARRIVTLQQPMPGGEFNVDQIARAYSELFEQLSTLISEAVEAHQNASGEN